jgi:hypothetical protein
MLHADGPLPAPILGQKSVEGLMKGRSLISTYHVKRNDNKSLKVFHGEIIHSLQNDSVPALEGPRTFLQFSYIRVVVKPQA